MEPMGENKAKGILGSGKLGPLLQISCFPRNFMYDHYGGRCGQGLILLRRVSFCEGDILGADGP